MIPTDTGLRPEILNPVARPVDTYAAPAAGEQLGQLADALSSMSPGLSRFSDAVVERTNASATQAGQNKARDLVESGKTYAQAIKEGLIDPHESPWFRLGAYETFGRVSANKYADDFRVALVQSPVSESTNPKDFDTFESQFRSQWAKDNLGDSQNPYFRNSFGTQADAQIAGERNAFATEAGSRLVGQVGDAFHAEVVQALKNGFTQGQDAATMAKTVNLAMQRQSAAGMGWKRINDLVTSAITQTASSDGIRNIGMLDVLDNIDVGANAKLGGTSGAMSARESSIEKIATLNNRDYVQESKRVKIAFNAEESDIATEASKRLLAAPDPATTNLDDLVDKMNNLDGRMVHAGVDIQAGSRVTELLKLRDAFATYGTKDDPDTARHLAISINTLAPGDDDYVTAKELGQAFGNKQLSLKTYRELTDDIQKRDKEGGTGHFMNDDGMKLIDQDMKNLLGPGFDKDGNYKPEYGARLAHGTAEARDQYLTWRKANPTASAADVNKEAYAIAARAAGRRVEGISGTTSSRGLTPPNFGEAPPPEPVDYKTQRATDQTSITTLSREWKLWVSGNAKGLSPASLQVLTNNNIDVKKPKDVQDFIAKQLNLLQP